MDTKDTVKNEDLQKKKKKKKKKKKLKNCFHDNNKNGRFSKCSVNKNRNISKTILSFYVKFTPFTHKRILYAINQKNLSSLFKMVDFQNGRFEA